MKETDVLTLSDDKEYTICAKVCYEGVDYYYLSDNENIENVKFVEHDKENNDMIVMDNPELFDKLLPLFAKRAEEVLKEVTE